MTARRDEPAALALVSARASLALAQDLACEVRWTPAMRAEIAQHASEAIDALRAVCRRLGTDALEVGADPWGLAAPGSEAA